MDPSGESTAPPASECHRAPSCIAAADPLWQALTPRVAGAGERRELVGGPATSSGLAVGAKDGPR